MSSTEEAVSATHRTRHVVSLPCGHQVYAGVDASLIALSGPVLDHQSTCRASRPPAFEAWFSISEFRPGDRAPGGSLA
jgi:hypothetical protein